MEIVTFKEQNWKEITKQDNPAFDYVYDNPRLQERCLGRREHCLLICKVLPYRQKAVGKDGYEVTEIPKTGDVSGRGLFWNLENAELFAEGLAEKIKHSQDVY